MGNGTAVVDCGNRTYRAWRVSNFGIANSATIFTISNGSVTNTADGQWRILNNAGTSSLRIQTNLIYLSHESAGNAIVANGTGTFLLGDEAQSVGGNIDAGTADTFKFKNLAKTDGAAIQAKTGAFSSLTSGKIPVASAGGLLVDLSASSAYTPTNVVTLRTYNADATSLDELADIVGTMIADLQAKGILG